MSTLRRLTSFRGEAEEDTQVIVNPLGPRVVSMRSLKTSKDLVDAMSLADSPEFSLTVVNPVGPLARPESASGDHAASPTQVRRLVNPIGPRGPLHPKALSSPRGLHPHSPAPSEESPSSPSFGKPDPSSPPPHIATSRHQSLQLPTSAVSFDEKIEEIAEIVLHMTPEQPLNRGRSKKKKKQLVRSASVGKKDFLHASSESRRGLAAAAEGSGGRRDRSRSKGHPHKASRSRKRNTIQSSFSSTAPHPSCSSDDIRAMDSISYANDVCNLEPANEMSSSESTSFSPDAALERIHSASITTATASSTASAATTPSPPPSPTVTSPAASCKKSPSIDLAHFGHLLSSLNNNCDVLLNDPNCLFSSAIVSQLKGFQEKSEALIRQTSYRQRRASVVPEVPHLSFNRLPLPASHPVPNPAHVLAPASASLSASVSLPPIASSLPSSVSVRSPLSGSSFQPQTLSMPPGLLSDLPPEVPPINPRPDELPLSCSSTHEDPSPRPRGYSRERISPRLRGNDTIVQASFPNRSNSEARGSAISPMSQGFDTLTSSPTPVDSPLGDFTDQRFPRQRTLVSNSRFRLLLGKWKNVEANPASFDSAGELGGDSHINQNESRVKVTELEEQLQRLSAELSLRQSQLTAAQQRFSSEMDLLGARTHKAEATISSVTQLLRSAPGSPEALQQALEILTIHEARGVSDKPSLLESTSLITTSQLRLKQRLDHPSQATASQGSPLTHSVADGSVEVGLDMDELPDDCPAVSVTGISLKNSFKEDGYQELLIFSPDSSAPSAKKSLLGGDLAAIICWLVSDNTNPSLLYSFLYTFRSFTTPAALIGLLVHLHDRTFHSSSDQDRAAATRSNIVRGFSQWVSRFCFHASEFKLLQNLLTPLINSLGDDPSRLSRDIAELKAQLDRGYMDPHEKYVNQSILLSLDRTPRPIMSKFRTDPSGKIELVSLAPQELARQMTLVEATLFSRITPTQFLSSIKKKHPNVQAIVDRFNLVSHWVATEIIMAPATKNRATLIRFFIKVARECLQMNNYNSLLEITAGLNMTAVRRLKKSWLSLASQNLLNLDDLEKLMDHRQNYKQYRTELRSAKRPTLPYFGIFLRDLTFIDVGNQLTLPNGSPNFERMCLLGQVIDQIQFHQEIPYLFPPVEAIQKSLQNLISFDEETLIAQSLGKE